MTFSCPACGAEVVFKSRFSVFGVCSFCRSTLVRHDSSCERLGQMTEMPADLSPVQVGTTGRYRGAVFAVVGRRRVGWEHGAWNEWYLHYDDGRDGWLADAQGLYALSAEQRSPGPLPDPKDLEVSSPWHHADVTYVVDDVREVGCVASEGELPADASAGRRSTSVDLVGPDQRFASIDFDGDAKRLFLGRYVDVDALDLCHLRELDGW